MVNYDPNIILSGMGMYRTLLLVLVVSLPIVILVSVDAESSTIPDWVKNNAKWWSEGAIEETDYISSLQYLISQGIIKIPIKQVIATDSPISEDDRAHSFVVRFDFGKGEIPIYSYSRMVEFGKESINISTPKFQLESIPSKDKMRIYEEVHNSVGSKDPKSFDVAIDIIAGDGSIIETLTYRTCKITDYNIYTNDNKEDYRFGKGDGLEQRDLLNIICGAFDLILP